MKSFRGRTQANHLKPTPILIILNKLSPIKFSASSTKRLSKFFRSDKSFFRSVIPSYETRLPKSSMMFSQKIDKNYWKNEIVLFMMISNSLIFFSIVINCEISKIEFGRFLYRIWLFSPQKCQKCLTHLTQTWRLLKYFLSISHLNSKNNRNTTKVIWHDILSIQDSIYL